eukprot:snap_masked-scaffold_6-processed-gene-11.31-mRNA-1 protein AED:1.00 eAED:1.00 QI:0/0/0/0/1/1/2/0/112
MKKTVKINKSTKEYELVELQGTLHFKEPGASCLKKLDSMEELKGHEIGEIQYDEQGKPYLTMENYVLKGKIQKLQEKFIVLDHTDNIQGILSRKIIFDSPPMPTQNKRLKSG